MNEFEKHQQHLQTIRARFQADVDAHLNEIIIDCTGRVGRLIGLTEDEDDFYYMIDYPVANGAQPQRVLASCVGPLVYTKKTINPQAYAQLDSDLTRLGAPPLEGLHSPQRTNQD